MLILKDHIEYSYQTWIVILLVTSILCENNDCDLTEKREKISYFQILPPVNFTLANAIDPEKIVYKLITDKNPDKTVILTEENVTGQLLLKNRKTIMVIHGWATDFSASRYSLLVKAYFQEGSFNIIFVDWTKYAYLSYAQSAANVPQVGRFVARFLIKSKIPAHKIHLLGHSLGAQLAAFVGKEYEKLSGRKIGRITGLDPAGPKWFKVGKENRLSELDADFVDVIHTDIQYYGFTNPCGHVDFYVNGGKNQPGCPCQEQKSENSENCDHHRSTDYFIESINKKVLASEINFMEDDKFNIVITPKENNPQRPIFGEHVSLKERGVYFLETNPIKPFLQIPFY